MRALVSSNSQTVTINIETNVQNVIKYMFQRAKRIIDVYVKSKDLLRRTFCNLLDIEYDVFCLDNAGSSAAGIYFLSTPEAINI